jgi:hypothetical protein
VALLIEQVAAFTAGHPDAAAEPRLVLDHPAGEGHPVAPPDPGTGLAATGGSVSGSLRLAQTSQSSRCPPASKARWRRLSPGRQGVQDRPAAGGRQVDAADRQQVVDPQLGPGPGQLGGHRAGSRAELGGQGGGVGALDLIGDQSAAVPGRQVSQCLGDRAGLLLTQRPLLRPVRLDELHQAVAVAGLGEAATKEGDGDVAGQHHRERRQGAVVEAWPGLQEPGEGLLHQVVDNLRVPDPGGHHPPDERGEGHQVLLPGVRDWRGQVRVPRSGRRCRHSA